MISYSKQFISNKDIEAVKKVLKSNYLTQGTKVPIFEKKIKKYVGAKYATAVSSASAALHLSCIALGLKKMIICGQYRTHLLPQLHVAYIVVLKLILLILTRMIIIFLLLS